MTDDRVREDDLVERLRDEAMRLSGRSLDRGCVDSGIASNLADSAANEIEALRARVKELEATLKWTDEVYPARISAGGAGVEITWDEFNAMREAAGFRAVKRIGDEDGRSGFNHRLRARLHEAMARAESAERKLAETQR